MCRKLSNSKFIQNSKFKIQNFEGFTMVELLVAMSLFAVIISIASGVFIKSLRTHRAAVALMAANDNASLSLEQISREIRIGSQFNTNIDSTQLSFFSQKAGNVIYRYNKDNGSIERNGITITGDNVKVDYLFFDLMGEELGDGASTRVTIRLGISAIDNLVSNVVTHLQTTVSSRQLDT